MKKSDVRKCHMTSTDRQLWLQIQAVRDDDVISMITAASVMKDDTTAHPPPYQMPSFACHRHQSAGQAQTVMYNRQMT